MYVSARAAQGTIDFPWSYVVSEVDIGQPAGPSLNLQACCELCSSVWLFCFLNCCCIYSFSVCIFLSTLIWIVVCFEKAKLVYWMETRMQVLCFKDRSKATLGEARSFFRPSDISVRKKPRTAFGFRVTSWAKRATYDTKADDFLSQRTGGDVSSCVQIPQADPEKSAAAPELRQGLQWKEATAWLFPSPGQTQPLKVCGDSGNSIIGIKVVAWGRNSIFQEGRNRFYCGVYAWLRMRHGMLLQGGRGGDLAGGWVCASFADLKLLKAISERWTLKSEVLIGVNDF